LFDSTELTSQQHSSEQKAGGKECSLAWKERSCRTLFAPNECSWNLWTFGRSALI